MPTIVPQPRGRRGRSPRPPLVAAATLLALSAVPAAALTTECGTLADDLVAARSGLVREWLVQVPFDSAAWRLEHVVVGGGLVVAQSSDGVVAAIQAAAAPGAPAAGRVLWSNRVGNPGGFSLPAGINGSAVALARDLEVFALDPATGQILWQEATGSPPNGPATPVGDWVYVPLAGEVLRLPIDPFKPTMPVRTRPGADQAAGGARANRPLEPAKPARISSGGRVDFPVVGTDESIFWTTTTGRMVALEQIEGRWDRAQRDLPSPPVSPPAIRERSLFVAIGAEDGGEPTLARIDLRRTKIDRLQVAWWMPLSERPTQGPFLAGETLVVSLGDAGLAAYSTAAGEGLWRSCVAGTIVAVGGERIWVRSEFGGLTAVDLASGAPRERLPLGCLTVPIVNTASDRLVLASPTGLVVSLAPRNPLPAPAAVPEPTRVSDRADPGAEPAAADPDATLP